jgi:hypothetical protein
MLRLPSLSPGILKKAERFASCSRLKECKPQLDTLAI